MKPLVPTCIGVKLRRKFARCGGDAKRVRVRGIQVQRAGWQLPAISGNRDLPRNQGTAQIRVKIHPKKTPILGAFRAEVDLTAAS